MAKESRAIVPVLALALMSSSVLADFPSIYYTDRGGVFRADPDGTHVGRLVHSWMACGLDLDLASGKMYWTTSVSEGDSGVYRANLDGTGVETIATALRFTTSLALDLSHNKVYWANWDRSWIRRANLDGTSAEVFISSIYLDSPTDLAVDPDGSRLFWTDYKVGHGGRIRYVYTDGRGGTWDLVTGLAYPLGIDLDLERGKIYWTDVYTDKIQRSNLDGSDVEDIVTGLVWPHGIELDVAGGRMYWTEGYANAPVHKICSANLDGSDVRDLISEGLSYPQEIAFAVPEPATLSLLALGGLAIIRRRLRR